MSPAEPPIAVTNCHPERSEGPQRQARSRRLIHATVTAADRSPRASKGGRPIPTKSTYRSTQ